MNQMETFPDVVAHSEHEQPNRCDIGPRSIGISRYEWSAQPIFQAL
jgi:hypothetical protein